MVRIGADRDVGRFGDGGVVGVDAIAAAGHVDPGAVGGGCRVNSRAALSGASLVVTPNVVGIAGSAFWTTPVPSSGLVVSFDATIDQGGGADGRHGVGRRGVDGADGVERLRGAGFGNPRCGRGVDTTRTPGGPSGNCGRGDGASVGCDLRRHDGEIPAFAQPTHHIDVTVSAGHVS